MSDPAAIAEAAHQHGSNGYCRWAEALPYLAAGNYVYREMAPPMNPPRMSVSVGSCGRMDLDPADAELMLEAGALNYGGDLERRERWYVLRRAR